MNGAAVRAWYATLEARERRVLVGGAIAAVALLLVGGVLLPLHGAAATAVARSERRREDLAWMRAHANAVRAGSATLRTPIAEPPLVLIDRGARDAGLAAALRGTEPAGRGIRVRLEGAPFDAMMVWLGTLDQRYGITVEAITVDHGAQPGTVDANVTLAPPPT
jgi:general secretion pathway protein M